MLNLKFLFEKSGNKRNIKKSLRRRQDPLYIKWEDVCFLIQSEATTEVKNSRYFRPKIKKKKKKPKGRGVAAGLRGQS